MVFEAFESICSVREFIYQCFVAVRHLIKNWYHIESRIKNVCPPRKTETYDFVISLV